MSSSEKEYIYSQWCHLLCSLSGWKILQSYGNRIDVWCFLCEGTGDNIDQINTFARQTCSWILRDWFKYVRWYCIMINGLFLVFVLFVTANVDQMEKPIVVLVAHSVFRVRYKGTGELSGLGDRPIYLEFFYTFGVCSAFLLV